MNAQLPHPDSFSFEVAPRLVRPEDMATTIPCGDDRQAVVEAMREFADAGFTDVALVQIGGDTRHDVLEWAGAGLLPGLRGV
ncbi:hypothetical protein JS756_02170 [Streptomyces actuosus]|uniref:Luciferase-like domain-containing protein n=1 Tax=Streptomyces actuosus TaxID=1885 RepID=A0ABS2VIL3_STRAS|nr:hypothetical protein [Streptomyces actuosus]MBN0042940.1 hypothetical protein [Streptomyces actuosus]